MTSIVKMEEDHLVLTGSWAVGRVLLADVIRVVVELPQGGYDSGWIRMKLPGKMDTQSDISLSRVEPPLILSVDIGTSSVKTVIFDRLGRSLASSIARRPVEIITRPDGTVVIDPDQLLNSVWDCLDETLARSQTTHQDIAGVGCCTFVSNILGVNREGEAITPVFTYADTRPTQEALWLRNNFDEAMFHQRTGCIFHPSYLPSRFVWLQRTHPEVLTGDLRWMSLDEYLAFKLFGETQVSYSVASWSGLLDRFRLDWDGDLLAILPIARNQLSALVDADQPRIGLKERFARRWPALKALPWFPAIGDGAAANLGSGCINPDRIALTMGSTTALRVVFPGIVPQIPQGLWCYQVDRSTSLLGGAMSEGGNVYAWLKKTLRVEDSLAEDFLKRAPADQHGLTFLPLLAGERSPGWRGDARGLIAGVSLATTAVDILQAALEGVAYRIGLIYGLLGQALPGEHRVIANGGALTRSPGWVQIIADVLGCRVTLSELEEASARGAAMLALRSLGVVPDLSAFPDLDQSEFLPDPVKHQAHLAAMLRQQKMYQSMI
jgi:gluconokinase